jgi:hypothetical protein
LKAQLMISLLHSVCRCRRYRGADAGGFKRLRQRFAGGRGADGEVAAAVMPDMAGPAISLPT